MSRPGTDNITSRKEWKQTGVFEFIGPGDGRPANMSDRFKMREAWPAGWNFGS